MKGLTIWYNEIERFYPKMSDELLGKVMRKLFDAMPTDEAPVIDGDDEMMYLFSTPFLKCFDKGLECMKNGKKGGAPVGNQNARKIKPNEDFDTTVSCYTTTQKVIVDDNSKKYYKYDTKHSDSINYMIDSNLGGLTLSTVRNTIIKEIEKDGWEPKEANSIYEEIIRGISR